MNIELLKESSRIVSAAIQGATPSCALILGSGWGEAVSGLTVKASIEYADIPCLGATQVEGHSGRLVFAEQAGSQVLVFQGRRHWYEGAGWEPVAFPLYLSAGLGVGTVFLTNAAGGISERLKPGDLMVIDDHINLMGVNPLVGAHHEVWGPRFPDQSEVYDKSLRDLLDEAGARAKVKLAHGVYAAVSGPAYETPAEIDAFRKLGVDAIGMSTVPEAMLANAAGLKVVGLSCVTNVAAGIAGVPLAHDEVIEQSRKIQPKMKELLSEFLVLSS